MNCAIPDLSYENEPKLIVYPNYRSSRLTHLWLYLTDWNFKFPNLKKCSMKQTKLYCALILVFLMLFSCEDDIPFLSEENNLMSLSTKSSIVVDDNILLIQATMQKVDSMIPFFDRFQELYGSPLWQYTIPMGEEERDISYLVPVYKSNAEKIINTIWFFDLVGDTLRYRTITRDNDSICYYQQDFVFDELSYNIFGNESTAKIKFEAPPQTRAWVKEYYDCHFGIIEWGEIIVHKELYCKERTVWKQETVIDFTDTNPMIGGETPIGGGGGGGTPPLPPDDDKKLKASNWEKSIPEIKEKIKKLGCNIDTIPIKLVTECFSNARVVVDKITGKKSIEICYKLFNYEYKDQVSILYHEGYHCLNDKPLSNNEAMTFDPPLRISLPIECEEYLLKYVYFDCTNPRQYLDNHRLISKLYSPEYYQNEIDAYKSERIAVPNVSTEYDAEREYLLWVNMILSGLSSSNYNL